MLKKIRGFWLTLIALVISIYVFSFWGLRPQIPTRALPLDNAGGLLSPVPVLSPSETNFWLRPWQYLNDRIIYAVQDVFNLIKHIFALCDLFSQFFSLKSFLARYVFHSSISCFCPGEILWSTCENCEKLGQNFAVLGGQTFLGRGLKYLTKFYKFGSPSNMFQNLVTIDRATSEIRRWNSMEKKHQRRYITAS